MAHTLGTFLKASLASMASSVLSSASVAFRIFASRSSSSNIIASWALSAICTHDYKTPTKYPNAISTAEGVFLALHAPRWWHYAVLQRPGYPQAPQGPKNHAEPHQCVGHQHRILLRKGVIGTCLSSVMSARSWRFAASTSSLCLCWSCTTTEGGTLHIQSVIHTLLLLTFSSPASN